MIKWGILGTSEIAGTMAQAIIANPDSTLSAVAGRSTTNIQAFSEKYHPKYSFSDYQALLDSPEVDVVYISLPNHLHATWAVKAFESQKAVLCEKSLSMNFAQSESIVEAAKHAKVFLCEALMYRFHPLTSKLISLLQGGAIGAIQSIHAYYAVDIAQVANPDGGAAILNLGCYPASVLQLIMRTCYGTEASNQYQMQANNSIRNAYASVMYDNGVNAQLMCADTYGFHFHLSVLGSEGMITLVDNPWCPNNNENQIILKNSKNQSDMIAVTSNGNAYDYQIKAVVAALNNNALEVLSPGPTLEDSLDTARLTTKWSGQRQASLQADAIDKMAFS